MSDHFPGAWVNSSTDYDGAGNGAHSGVLPLDVLEQLRVRLQLLVPALTIGEGGPESAALLAGIRATTESAESLLRVAEPHALAAIRAGLACAAAAEHDESRTEFLAAYHKLSVLLHADRPRRQEAAFESTKRWRLED